VQNQEEEQLDISARARQLRQTNEVPDEIHEMDLYKDGLFNGGSRVDRPCCRAVTPPAQTDPAAWSADQRCCFFGKSGDGKLSKCVPLAIAE
jgi:hypothetical protein